MRVVFTRRQSAERPPGVWRSGKGAIGWTRPGARWRGRFLEGAPREEASAKERPPSRSVPRQGASPVKERPSSRSVPRQGVPRPRRASVKESLPATPGTVDPGLGLSAVAVSHVEVVAVVQLRTRSDELRVRQLAGVRDSPVEVMAVQAAVEIAPASVTDLPGAWFGPVTTPRGATSVALAHCLALPFSSRSRRPRGEGSRHENAADCWTWTSSSQDIIATCTRSRVRGRDAFAGRRAADHNMLLWWRRGPRPMGLGRAVRFGLVGTRVRPIIAPSFASERRRDAAASETRTSISIGRPSGRSRGLRGGASGVCGSSCRRGTGRGTEIGVLWPKKFVSGAICITSIVLSIRNLLEDPCPVPYSSPRKPRAVPLFW